MFSGLSLWGSSPLSIPAFRAIRSETDKHKTAARVTSSRKLLDQVGEIGSTTAFSNHRTRFCSLRVDPGKTIYDPPANTISSVNISDAGSSNTPAGDSALRCSFRSDRNRPLEMKGAFGAPGLADTRWARASRLAVRLAFRGSKCNAPTFASRSELSNVDNCVCNFSSIRKHFASAQLIADTKI